MNQITTTFPTNRPVPNGGGAWTRTRRTIWTVLLWVLSLLVAVASLRFLVFGVEASMEQVLYHEQVRPLVLYGHIFFAPIALGLVPFQLWQGLRKRRPLIHRVLGRIYGISILISGLAGFWLGITANSGIFAVTGFSSLAVVWLATTGIAIAFAMQHDYAGHRRWIIRSVALTLSAVTLRLYIIPSEMLDLGNDAYQAIAWLAWVPNLIVAEIYLRWPRWQKRRQRALAA